MFDPSAASTIAGDRSSIISTQSETSSTVMENSAVVNNNVAAGVYSASGSPDPTTLSEVPGFPLWRSVRTDTGATYYFNIETNETSWTPPVAPSTVPPVQDVSSMSRDELNRAYQERLAYFKQLQQQQQELEDQIKQ
jgi:hypothetical protein